MNIAAQPVPFQSASLYVGDLHPDITEGTLFELFNRVGPVASIRICRDTITKRSLGYGYVNFHNVQDAERAIDTMNFSEINGTPCRIMWSQRDPHLRKSGVGNIFIKNLQKDIDTKTLFDTFSVYGNILSCKVATDDKGASKGYGYIHYETAEAANEAIKNFNGNMLNDVPVTVIAFVRRQERSSTNNWTNLYVKQFPKSWDEKKLNELFAPHGELLSLAIMKDAEGNSKGFAFVNYATHESANAAVNTLNKKEVSDDSITLSLFVGPAQKKADRSRELTFSHQQKREEKLNQFQGRNLYVKNIDDEVTDEELLKAFSEHGTVANAKIMRENGASKGFGFVCYNTSEDALKAISAMNGTRIRSKPIIVTLHQTKKVRAAHLSATFGNRMRGFPQGPGGMAPMPYMYMQGGQGGFPAQQRGFYGGEFPQGRGPRGAMPVRPSFYPMPPYNMQQGPMGGQGMMPQMKRMGPGQGPMGPNMGGPMMGGRGMRNAPRPGTPQGRGMPPQFPAGAAGPRGGMKFTNQVRNQPVPVGMPQQLDMPMQMHAAQPMGVEPLNQALLLETDPNVQRNMIGERLYPLVERLQPQRAGKITGMLLEMEITELINLLEDAAALNSKVGEAVMVLEQHEREMNQ